MSFFIFSRVVSVVYYPGLALGGDEPGYYFRVVYTKRVLPNCQSPETVLKNSTVKFANEFGSSFEQPSCFLRESKPKVQLRGFQNCDESVPENYPVTSRVIFEDCVPSDCNQKKHNYPSLSDGLLGTAFTDYFTTVHRRDKSNDYVWSAGKHKGLYWFRCELFFQVKYSQV